MAHMEIHPGEGGADAEAFAVELGTAVARYTGSPVVNEGTTLTLHRL